MLSVLISGIIVFPSSFADDHVNGTANNGTSTNSTSTEENMVVDDQIEILVDDKEEMMEDVEMMENLEIMEDKIVESVLSPLKQIKEGVSPENIVCKEGLELIFKISGQPACIQTSSVEKLIAWGWAQ
ncbi:MAG: hypothetical protein KGZ34_08220 [Nitrosarchaeum sp.]|nr:hypothetical protein [Nitrosarchaeum sp.]